LRFGVLEEPNLIVVSDPIFDSAVLASESVSRFEPASLFGQLKSARPARERH
jgi:hypothetical protein